MALPAVSERTHLFQVVKRLISKIKFTPGPLDSDCWIWEGCIINTGYGTIFFNGRSHLTHRAAYQLACRASSAP